MDDQAEDELARRLLDALAGLARDGRVPAAVARETLVPVIALAADQGRMGEMAVAVVETEWAQRHAAALTDALCLDVLVTQQATPEHAAARMSLLRELARAEMAQDDDRSADDSALPPIIGVLARLGRPAVVDRLVAAVWDQAGTPMHEAAVQLLCEVTLNTILSAEAYAKLDRLFIAFVFDQVELTRDHPSATLNLSLTKLLLAINEQCAIQASRSPGTANAVMDIVAERGTGMRTLSENVAAMFNRGGADDIRDGSNASVQILLLKFLYLVFSRRATADMFYPNDLKVIVDILVRELLDLPRDKPLIRQGHLRVLQCLLAHSPYRRQGRHKKTEVRRVLEAIWADEQTDGATRGVAEQVLLESADVLE